VVGETGERLRRQCPGPRRGRSQEGSPDGVSRHRPHQEFLQRLPPGAPAEGLKRPSKGPRMLDGPSVATALKSCGVTHVVWIPDSELGLWEAAFSADPGLQLVRACREGEAIAIAAGLLLGGKRPVVMIQCTGFFEAGDA